SATYPANAVLTGRRGRSMNHRSIRGEGRDGTFTAGARPVRNGTHAANPRPVRPMGPRAAGAGGGRENGPRRGERNGNKSMWVLAGLATLAATVCVNGRLLAQPVRTTTTAAPAAPAAKSKVAILNLKYVVTNYQRYKNFLEETKKSAQKYEEQLK